jgi:heat shock protein HslJ
MIRFIVIFSLLCTIAACKTNRSSSSEDQPQTDQSMLLHDIWALEKIEQVSVTQADFGREIPVLEFHVADQKVMGNSGCNQLSGSCKVEGNKITLGPLMSTKMACPGNGEQRFLNALHKVNSFRIEGLKLFLLEGGVEKLQFKKVD